MNVASSGGNCSPEFKLQCEARYWLAAIDDAIALVIADDENNLAMATADDIKRAFDAITELLLKKRGSDGLKKILNEMLWQWFEQKQSILIDAVYNGRETLTELLKLGAGCDKENLSFPVQKSGDGR